MERVKVKKKFLSMLMVFAMLVSLVVPVTVCAADFSLSTGNILKDNGYTAYTENVTFAGRTGLLEFTNTSAQSEQRIRYGINMPSADISADKYLLVECYLADDSAGSFSLGAVFRKSNNSWILENGATPTACKPVSDTYPANKWVKVTIDCRTAFDYLKTNKAGQALTEMQINIPSTTGSFYMSNARFSDVPGDFVLNSGKLLTGDSGLATFSTGASAGGKTNVLEVNTTSKTDIRYQDIGMTAANAGTVRYLLVDIYYAKSSSTTTPYGISATFRQVNNKDNWTMYNYNNGVFRNISSGLAALPNRWETIAIDCFDAMNYMYTNSFSLWGMQIALPQASGSDRIFISNVRFAGSTGDYELGRTATIMS